VYSILQRCGEDYDNEAARIYKNDKPHNEVAEFTNGPLGDRLVPLGSGTFAAVITWGEEHHGDVNFTTNVMTGTLGDEDVCGLPPISGRAPVASAVVRTLVPLVPGLLMLAVWVLVRRRRRHA